MYSDLPLLISVGLLTVFLAPLPLMVIMTVIRSLFNRWYN